LHLPHPITTSLREIPLALHDTIVANEFRLPPLPAFPQEVAIKLQPAALAPVRHFPSRLCGYANAMRWGAPV